MNIYPKIEWETMEILFDLMIYLYVVLLKVNTCLTAVIEMFSLLAVTHEGRFPEVDLKIEENFA